MQAGFYEADITPQLGMEKPGGFEKAHILEIDQKLKVRASVISDGKNRAAFVGIDSVGVNKYPRMQKIREDIQKRCGIPASNILIAASHTHAGGPFSKNHPDDLADAPEIIKKLLMDYGSATCDPFYFKLVAGQIVTAVCEADRRKEDAVLCAGVGQEDKVVFNRRFKMKQGRVYTHPGKCNPDLLEPAGPVDPDVGVIGAWSAKKDKFLGAIVNYACHGTVMAGSASSPDWIFYLEKTIRSFMGENSTVVFLNGASADITQVDNQDLVIREYGHWFARRLGTRVGAEALKVLVTSPAGDLQPVKVLTNKLFLKRRVPGKDKIAAAKKTVEQGISDLENGRIKQKDLFNAEWLSAKSMVIVDWLAEKSPEVEVEIQAIQVGPAIFLSNPAEYFCSLGLKIKEASAFPYTLVVELANGAIGYIPDKESFLPSGGGYETWLTHGSNMETGAGEKIAEASIALSKKLSPGKEPELKKQDFIGTPWEFGVLGPDREE